MATELTIIHTNDTHGRMIAPVSERLRALREAHPSAILLDAGDAVGAGNLGFRMAGEPALVNMSALGYDAMCLGNRETHPRKEIFPRKISDAAFPVLSANAVAKNGATLPVRGHVVLSAAGVRVGVFGVTVPMFTRKQWSQPLCDYWFDDPIRAAQAEAARLRAEVDVLIALTHIGFRKDCVLAQLCPEVDLVIGGHSHTRLDEPHWEGTSPVLQAWAFGYYAGVARIEMIAGHARLCGWESIPLRDDIPHPKPSSSRKSAVSPGSANS